MKRRQKLNRKKSRRLFSKTASKTNRRNLAAPSMSRPMRGGIRL